jgi:phage terminase small subunit
MSIKKPLKRVKLKNTSRHDPTKGPDGLNAKQRRFAQEFCVDYNMTAAAKRAGYSKKTSYAQGQRLLKNAEIAAYIARQQAKLSQKTEISAERVLQEIAKLAFADIPLKDIRPGEKLSALRDLGTHLNLFKQSVEVDNRMSILNVSVSAADLESARSLVENFRAEPKLIEGKVEPEDEDAK